MPIHPDFLKRIFVVVMFTAAWIAMSGQMLTQ